MSPFAYDYNHTPCFANFISAVSGDQFVVATFAGQQGPSAPPTRTVERSSIIVFTITVAIVAMPGRAIRCFSLEQCVRHSDTVANH
jgi:hypothetical protein